MAGAAGGGGQGGGGAEVRLHRALLRGGELEWARALAATCTAGATAPALVGYTDAKAGVPCNSCSVFYKPSHPDVERSCKPTA